MVGSFGELQVEVSEILHTFTAQFKFQEFSCFLEQEEDLIISFAECLIHALGDDQDRIDARLVVFKAFVDTD